jgi:serine/threonine-protein kinase RsbT
MLDEQEVAAVSRVLRRVFARRVPDVHHLDDLVQETLTRIVKARPQLGGDELTAYAVVTARNTLIAAARRQRDVPDALADDVVIVDDPGALVVNAEEADAVRQVMASLPDADRQALLAHEVDGRTTAHLATEAGSTPGAIAARLARVRARARVDYVVALRNVTLPTDRCYDVLVALSSGLRRRQIEVGAGDHLLTCVTCAELAPPVVERRRSLAAIVPIFGIPAALGRARRAAAEHPVAAAGVATGAALAVVVGVSGIAGRFDPFTDDRDRRADRRSAVTVEASSRRAGPSTAATAATAPATTAPIPTASTAAGPAVTAPPAPGGACQVLDPGGTPLAVGGADALAGLSGLTVSIQGATVEAAVGDAGFWATCGPARLWVQIIGPVAGLPAAGQTVSAVGVVAPHGPGYASSVGGSAGEGGVDLDLAGVHVETARVM